MKKQHEKGYLVLSDGTVLEGKRFGAVRDSIGELVFTTGMGGYVETLTDPSYYGQIIMQTFPLIGNYGIMEEDFEGASACRGYVVREYCDAPSNFRCQYDLDRFLKEKNVPGLYGIDTRALTRKLREHGVMNAIICSKVPSDLSSICDYAVTEAVSSVTCHEVSVLPAVAPVHHSDAGKNQVSVDAEWAPTEAKYRVVLIDYGAKRNIARKLQKRGCQVHVVPSTTTAQEILAMQPDGIMLSNGPGDPEENVDCIAELKKLIGKKPIFGICLGHQLTALAMGGETYKLKYGHRGANQPARDMEKGGSGRTFITTQNHGYAVRAESLSQVAEPLFINANDGTCEGLTYPGLDCFTVQFHPEAHAGPHDTGYLFDRFTAMMEARKLQEMKGEKNA